MKYKIQRVITKFKKYGEEEFIDEVILNNPSISELQKLFNVASNNPMYDCFEIKDEHLLYFKKNFGIDLDLKKNIYYLECNEVE